MRKILSMFIFVAFTLICSLIFVGCDFGVVPGAWIKFKVDGGRVVYTSNMYASGGPAILYYENSEVVVDEEYAISISFYPRIMGKDERNGEDTTIVDMSEKQAMKISVRKTSLVYSPEKSIYLNGEKLTPESNGTSESEYLKIMFFDNLEFKRGNPGGHENNIVNVIEYKV